MNDTVRRFLFLSRRPAAASPGEDPRPQQLYGDRAIWLAAEDDLGRAGNGSDAEVIAASFQPPALRNRPQRRELLANVDKTLNAHPDGILVIRPHHVAYWLARAGYRFVFDPGDSNGLNQLRRIRTLSRVNLTKAMNASRLALEYTRLERRITRACPAVIAPSIVDSAFYSRIGATARICVVGNGTAAAESDPVRKADDGRTIGFHGGMAWEPNRLTAVRLATVVARRLNGESEGCRLRIAGQPVSEELARMDGRHGVEICGFVEDLRDWMASLSLYVMPMYCGAGIKNKLIEAMAMGVPVLTNRLGAEALEQGACACVAVAANDSELVATIPRLLADPDRLAEMRARGRAYAVQHYRWEAQRRTLDDQLHELKARGRL